VGEVPAPLCGELIDFLLARQVREVILKHGLAAELGEKEESE